MLRKRLIPVLNIMNGHIVRSESFSIHQNIGNIINQASRYNEWEVDELIYLDISREQVYDLGRDDHKVSSYKSMDEIIRKISKVCFMPLSFGGGIRTIEDVDIRIQNGADKVVINTLSYSCPELIEKIAIKYGRQSIIISIDYKIINGEPIVYFDKGLRNSGINLKEWSIKCKDLGAGEIFMNCIDRDGKANGFDVRNIDMVVGSVDIPVIACGGAGDYMDFIDLAKNTDVSGIAAGNLFHFVERAYPRAKKIMKKEGINVR